MWNLQVLFTIEQPNMSIHVTGLSAYPNGVTFSGVGHWPDQFNPILEPEENLPRTIHIHTTYNALEETEYVSNTSFFMLGLETNIIDDTHQDVILTRDGIDIGIMASMTMRIKNKPYVYISKNFDTIYGTMEFFNLSTILDQLNVTGNYVASLDDYGVKLICTDPYVQANPSSLTIEYIGSAIIVNSSGLTCTWLGWYYNSEEIAANIITVPVEEYLQPWAKIAYMGQIMSAIQVTGIDTYDDKIVKIVNGTEQNKYLEGYTILRVDRYDW
jgi:hypothetical protein